MTEKYVHMAGQDRAVNLIDAGLAPQKRRKWRRV